MNASKRDSRVYLQDILDAIAKIEKYTAKGEKDFFSSGLVQDSVLYQLSIIGEASAKLPIAMRTTNENVPWKNIIGMRNVIIHDYSEIKIERIWETVEHDLRLLKDTVGAILKAN